MKSRVLKINDKDNVLVALQDLEKGTGITHENILITVQEAIPAKHKFYISDMQTGDEVIMYGVLVGKMQQQVKAGTRMSTENVKHASEPYYYRPSHFQWHAPDVSEFRT